MQLRLLFSFIIALTPAIAQSPIAPTPEELADLRRQEPQRATQGLDWLAQNKTRLGLDTRFTFQYVTSFTDSLGTYHGRYREYFNGLRVVGGNAIVHIRRTGAMEPPTLKLYQDISIPTTPTITQAGAIARATADYNPGGRIPDVESAEVELLIEVDTMQVDRGEPSPSQLASNPRYRRHEQVVRGYRLLWHVELSTDRGGVEPRGYVIDAVNGTIVRSWIAADNDTAETASGLSWYHGAVQFRTKTYTGQSGFRAVDPDHGGNGGSVFLNANYGTSRNMNNYSAYSDPDNNWGDGGLSDGTQPTDSDRAKTRVADAMYALGFSWDLLGLYGRNGWDNKGNRLFVRLHWNQNDVETYTDANFKSSGLAKLQGMFLGNGSSSTGLRTIGHELAHGFFDSIFGYTHKPNQEWRGINEGQADVFGSLVELFAYKAPGEVKRYSDMDGEWRWHARMIDPQGYTAAGQQGYRYWTTGLGDKEEHTVGCLLGHMFIFLADGATNNTNSTLSSVHLPHGMAGIGVEPAAFYYMRAMTGYFPEKGDYYDLRDAFLDAAESQWTPTGVKEAIYAAFAGIGVGTINPNGPDSQKPQIHEVSINRIEEDAGFLEIEVNAADRNMARVDVLLNGQLVISDTRRPFGGPVNLIGLNPGTHFLTIRAYDTFGNMESTLRNFAFNGHNSLVVNGGFEANAFGWQGAAQLSSNWDLAFAGRNYARLTGDWAIWQDINIPAAAESVRLLYRVRAENHSDAGFRNGLLEVRLLDPATGTAIATLATHQEGVETFENALTRTYRQMEIPLSQRGNVRLEFRITSDGNNHRFKIDNVAVIAQQQTKSSVKATVRNGEETVEFATTLTGFNLANIKEVKYYLNDAYEQNAAPLVTISGGPDFRGIITTMGLPRKTHIVIASVRYHDNTEATKAGTYFTLSTVNDRILNGGFEQGLNHWPVTGGANTTQKAPDLPNPCFTGLRCGLLGNILGFATSSMAQNFTIPNTAQAATLTYRLRVETDENANGHVDTFRACLLDSNNNKTYLGPQFSNMTVTDDIKGWMLVTVPIPANKKGALKLVFESHQNATNRTRFLIDNVSVVVQSLGLQILP